MIRPGEAYSIPFETTVAGVRTAAQSTPTAVLRRNGSSSGVSVTVTGSGGLYRGAFTADAGWSEYDRLEMDITADLDAASNYQGIVWDSGSEPIASVTTLESRLTATRAGYLDKLNFTGTLANHVWAYVIDGTRSAASLIRIFTAILAGKASRSGGATTFRNIADTKDVITSTADGTSRTSVTIDDDT
jgi:hypothetical protein